MPRTNFGKKRPIDNPYAIYKATGIDGEWEWRVLKTYKHSSNEDSYSRVFVAAKSPFTHRSWEQGDMYIGDLFNNAHLTFGTEEWVNEYYTDIIDELE